MDREEFERIYEVQIKDNARAYARAQLKDDRLADEIVHDTYTEIWENFGKFEGRAKISTFFRTVLNFRIIDGKA